MADARREVVIPYCPRNWAVPLHASFRRWGVLVLHRRAGKTTAILNHHQRAALDSGWETARLKALLPAITTDELAALLKRRVYWHVMPSYHQAKLTGAWDTLKEIARVVPGHKANESELLVTYPNGSKIQLIGADKPDSLRGPGLSGLSLDEYSQIPAQAFSEVLSKSLADHVGYCLFSGTIKGTDQLYQTYQVAKSDPDWFALWQDVDVSLRTETGATLTALERAMTDDRKLVTQGLMTQDEFDQEWFLSTDAAIKGAFYLTELRAAKDSGRIRPVPHDPTIVVDTDWDLGIDDNMAIWFSQSLRSGEVRIIDYYEHSGEGLPHYIQVLNQRGYTYGQHWAPHDIEVRELGTGKSRRDVAAKLGLKFHVVPQLPVEDGIHAARLFLATCYFDDGPNVGRGLECLRHYRKKYNTVLNEFTGVPVHDVFSHGADAFRGLAVRHHAPREALAKARQPPPVRGPMGWAS